MLGKMGAVGTLIINICLALLKSGKASMANVAVTGLAFAALWYFGTQMVEAGDARNAAAIASIRTQAVEKESGTAAALKVLAVEVSALTESVREVKKNVDTANTRLWDVQKDLYQIKGGNSDG